MEKFKAIWGYMITLDVTKIKFEVSFTGINPLWPWLLQMHP